MICRFDLLLWRSAFFAIMAVLLSNVRPCTAQEPENHSADDQVAQLLRQLNAGGADAAAAKRSLDAFMRSGDTAVYHILANPDHDLAKMALDFIGNRTPRGRTGVESPFAGAGPFLIEMCKTAPDVKTRQNALFMLQQDSANYPALWAFLGDGQIDGIIRYRALTFFSAHLMNRQISPAEQDAMDAAIPSLLAMWDQKLWEPKKNPELESADVEQKHNTIASVFLWMHPTLAVLKALPQIAVNDQLAEALMRSFLRYSREDLPDSALFSVVGYAASSPGGGLTVVNVMSRDLWARESRSRGKTDFYAALASADPSVRKGAAYALVGIRDEKLHTPQRINVLADLAASPEFQDNSDFRRLLAKAICESRPEAIDDFVATALTGNEPAKSRASTILSIAADADQPLPEPPSHAHWSGSALTASEANPGRPNPEDMPGSRTWLQSAKLVRATWTNPSSKLNQRTANLLNALGSRAGPITRLQLGNLTRQGSGGSDPNIVPELLPLPHQPAAWSPMPQPPSRGPLAAVDSGSSAFSIATLAFVMVVLLAAGCHGALRI